MGTIFCALHEEEFFAFQHAEWNRFCSRSTAILLRICCMICRHLHATTVRSHLVLIGNTCNFAQIEYSRFHVSASMLDNDVRQSMYGQKKIRCMINCGKSRQKKNRNRMWTMPSLRESYLNSEWTANAAVSWLQSYRRRERMQWRFSLCQFKFTWSFKFMHFYRPDIDGRRHGLRFTWHSMHGKWLRHALASRKITLFIYLWK